MKIFIPTAGIGQRLKNLTTTLNKSLITVGSKPAISHIIDMFPNNSEFVIAIGFQGEKVRDYLKLVYPQKKIKFVKIKKFQGSGSGLTRTLFESKKYLQEPFYFISCDTIIKGKIPKSNNNWIGVSRSRPSKSYRRVSIKKNNVLQIFNKNQKINLNQKNYIGFSFIKDYQNFWEQFKNLNKKTLELGEIIGMQALIENKLKAYSFDWYDTGNLSSLEKTRKSFKDKEFNILEKENEAIWFLNNSLVVKYSDSEKFIKKRVLRQKILKKFTPKIIHTKENFYTYKKIKGKILSKCINPVLFIKLLKYLEKFWFPRVVDKKKFEKNCYKFYKNKTLERVSLFLKNNRKYDKIEKINNIKIPKISTILNNIEWKKLSRGISVNFHGDLHFENIIFSKNKFVLLDWRQDFDKNLKIGDLYYELAKIMHGIIVSHERVLRQQFKIKQLNKQSYINIYISSNYKKILKLFEKWIVEKKLSLEKVRILTGLIFLNIAPLHHYPYNIFLFKLGKLLTFNSKNFEIIKKW